MQKNNPIFCLENTDTLKKKYRLKRVHICIILIIAVFTLSGCVTLFDPEASQDYNVDVVGQIDNQTNIGQSFVSRRPRLNGVVIWVSILAEQSGEKLSPPLSTIQVALYHSPGDAFPLYSTSIQVPSSGDNIPITVSLPAQKDPAGTSYYLRFSSEAAAIQLKGRNEDAYPQGQTYINAEPKNWDIAFRLSYDYNPTALLEDISHFFQQIWLVFPILVLFWLPGWLLLDVSKLRRQFDMVEQTGISIGISLALIPLVMLWTTVLKIHWTSEVVFVIVGLLVAFFIARIVYSNLAVRIRNPDNNGDQTDVLSTHPRFFRRLNSSTTLLFFIIFIGSLSIRLIMVRDLATPAWVDSVHHALITRLILENGSYPSTYLPYLNIASTAYHPGFHSIAAFFTWLSHLDLTQSLLILGQVLNGFAVFSVYLLTKTLTHNSTASLLAAFITGFITPMPAYYTSWGRFTELTGLLIFPVVLALILVWQNQEGDRRTAWIILLSAILAGGLFMIHYRVVVFLGCLLLVYLLLQLFTQKRTVNASVSNLLLIVTAVVIVSFVIVLPWIIPTIKNLIIPKLTTNIETTVSPFSDFSWPYLTSALGKQAMAIAGLGLIWSIIKHRSLAILLTLWIALMFILANLDSLKLPGSGLITNISVEIILFIPISILGGYFLEQLLASWRQFFPPQVKTAFTIGTLIIFGFIAYLGAKQLIPILNPVTILSRQADLPAIQWVNDHLAADEQIAINPFPWGYGLYAGNDGGYWIEPLSGRFTLTPPVLYGLGPGYKQISQLSLQVISLSSDPSALRDFLLSEQIQYIFIGARGGVLPPEQLVSSGLYKVLYHQEGAWILAVRP